MSTMTIIIIISVISIIAILNYILYIRIKTKYDEEKYNLNAEKTDYEKKKNKLNNKLSNIEKILNDDVLIGFYDSHFSYDLQQTIDVRIFVKEKNRYKNGSSNIELIKIELLTHNISGRITRALEIKIENEFNTLKNTADIEWLEPETSIKEDRRKKLEKIKKLKL